MSSEHGVPYASATAFERALSDRIARSSATLPYGVPQLRRQFAYGRMLARVFIHDPDRWVLKGATGLLARLPGQARHSMDIDFYFDGEVDAAIDSLRKAVETDLGDFFTFDIEPGTALTGVTTGSVLRATAYLGDKVFESFRVDIVVLDTMTAEADLVSPIELVEVPGLRGADYRTHPIPDQIADKYAAMLGTYAGRPSTRYRDLVDLVLIVTSQPVDAFALRRAIESEQGRRGISSERRLVLPSADWREGYRQVAVETPNFRYLDADEALDIVQLLIAPAIVGSVTGVWSPDTLEWV